MKKILLIAKYGHDLRYFGRIRDYAKETGVASVSILINLPIFFRAFFKCFVTTFDKDLIKNISDFSIKRKIIKYGSKKAWWYKWSQVFLAKLYLLKYEYFFLKNKYDFIGVWGGNDVYQMVVKVLADKFDYRVLVFENGCLPNSGTCDFGGVNFQNSVPREKSFYDNVPELSVYQEDLVARKPKLDTKYQQIELPKKYVFIPFQVALDSQILLFSPWISDMYEFYHVIESALDLIEDKEIIFVIKCHPSCSVSYNELFDKNPRIIFANGNSTQELIIKSEMVITINSSVGIEAIMFDKKVLTIGLAFYSIYGLAHHANSVSEIANEINNIESWEIDKKFIGRFVYYLRNNYLLPHPNSEKHCEALFKKLLLT